MAPNTILTFSFLLLCLSPAVLGRAPPSLLRLNTLSYAENESQCEQTYGFLPCTTTALGNVFLMLVYGYFMFLAATYMSSGSELLLAIIGPGIVGGLFLPILGSVPDALLILVSGLSGSKETAQSQVSVGMGLLAGSTVLVLTLIWGTCILVGKCDIHDTIAKDGQDTRGYSLTGSGVSTDIWTSYAARIMALSLLPFLVVQLPEIMNSTSGKHVAVLIALIVSVSMLVTNCVYQMYQPWIQRRKIAFSKDKHVKSGILSNLKKNSLGRLIGDDGRPNKDVLNKLFKTFDSNNNGYISTTEMRGLIVGIQFDEMNLEEKAAVEKVMGDFDTSQDNQIDFPEFVEGISKWLNEAKGRMPSSQQADPTTIENLDDVQQDTQREQYLLGDQSDEKDEGVENVKQTTVKAVLFLLLGAVVAAAFADPLVDAVDNFSSATSIPSFFISFIALPFATNTSEAVSSIIFASRKNQRSASLTFSELYGSATMNNILCLSVFLALIYLRGLTWDFSSEVLVIIIVCVVMGGIASIRTTFPLWMTSIAFLLYPFSLALVYVLDSVFGWS